MSDDTSRKRLGRGLAALIGDMDEPVTTGPSQNSAEPHVSADRSVPIESIFRNSNNPRREFDDGNLADLANSIAVHGVVQPLLVRPVSQDGSDRWEIVAGERRWRAAQQAGLHQVPIVIRDVDDRQALELAIVENVQRADLNPIEEAMGYQQLMDNHDYTQQDLAQTIAKSRSHVANTLRLLKLPASLQDMVKSGDISSGHARALVTVEAPEKLARRIVKEGLSVRETEKLAADPNGAGHASNTGKPNIRRKSADTIALEKRLSDHLGLKVVINHQDDDGGKLMISYRSLDQLDGLAQRLVR